MKELIKDCLYYCGKDDESFGIIDPVLPLEFRNDRELELYFRNYTLDSYINSGQTKISLYFNSLEDLFIVSAYFINCGWYNRMRFVRYRKKYINSTEIKKRRLMVSDLVSWDWFNFSPLIKLDIVVDRGNNFNRFILDLKSIPDYKILWRIYPEDAWTAKKSRVNVKYVIK